MPTILLGLFHVKNTCWDRGNPSLSLGFSKTFIFIFKIWWWLCENLQLSSLFIHDCGLFLLISDEYAIIPLFLDPLSWSSLLGFLERDLRIWEILLQQALTFWLVAAVFFSLGCWICSGSGMFDVMCLCCSDVLGLFIGSLDWRFRGWLLGKIGLFGCFWSCTFYLVLYSSMAVLAIKLQCFDFMIWTHLFISLEWFDCI